MKTQIRFLPFIARVLCVTGDLANLFTVHKWGGLLNEVAILLFLGTTIYSIAKGKK